VKSFQRTFAEGDPLRYIVLNATLARYTYARNGSLGRHTEIFRTMYHLKLQLKYDGIFRVNYIRFRLDAGRSYHGPMRKRIKSLNSHIRLKQI